MKLLKNLIPIIALTFLFSSCNKNSETNENSQSITNNNNNNNNDTNQPEQETQATDTAIKTIPSTPIDVLVIGIEDGISISWKATEGADSYNIYWKKSNGVSVNDNQITGIVSTNYNHINILKGYKYHYVVTAKVIFLQKSQLELNHL
jgi:hypothetical protein